MILEWVTQLNLYLEVVNLTKLVRNPILIHKEETNSGTTNPKIIRNMPILHLDCHIKVYALSQGALISSVMKVSHLLLMWHHVGTRTLTDQPMLLQTVVTQLLKCLLMTLRKKNLTLARRVTLLSRLKTQTQSQVSTHSLLKKWTPMVKCASTRRLMIQSRVYCVFKLWKMSLYGVTACCKMRK